MTNGELLTRIEIDVFQGNEILESFELAHKYRLPAIIVHPSLSSDALVCRGRSKGKYKIITPVDWPKGEVFSTDKFKGLSLDSLETDGFEIYISPKKQKGDIRKEINSCTEFLKKFIGELCEIRFVIGTRTKDEADLASAYEAFRDLKTPTLIRDDITLKTQNYKANPAIHSAFITNMSQFLKCPIKVSGNLDCIEDLLACEPAKRFGASLQQTKGIIRSINTVKK